MSFFSFLRGVQIKRERERESRTFRAVEIFFNKRQLFINRWRMERSLGEV